jgi:hypothetical protein
MYDEFSSPTTHNFVINGDGSSVTAEANKGITPNFYRMPILNPSKTAKEGRPIYDDMEVVMILVAGDPFNQIVVPVDNVIKERFPVQYDAWAKKNEGLTVSGTPIRQWPLLSPANIAEFEGLKIYSVEALAGVADANVTRSHGLREWREKAKVWLEVNKDSAAAVAHAAENVKLNAKVDELTLRLQEMSDQITSLSLKGARGK